MVVWGRPLRGWAFAPPLKTHHNTGMGMKGDGVRYGRLAFMYRLLFYVLCCTRGTRGGANLVDHLDGGKVSSQKWHGKANTLQESMEALRDVLAALFIETALFERSEFAVSMNAFSRQVIP